MPLEPYQYQLAGSKASTPSPIIEQGFHGRRPSASSLWSSPESVDTRATTPNISPLKYQGRDILPRIRPCDQYLEPELETTSLHYRAQSQGFDPAPSTSLSRPRDQRAYTCPPETDSLCTPISAASTQDPWAFSSIESPQFYAPVARGGYPGHAKSISTSAIDPTTFRRHAFPYRTVPQYITQAPVPQYTAPTVQPQLLDFVTNPFTFPSHPLCRELTPEFLVETGDEPTTTIMSYLTDSNPAIHLVPADNIEGTNNQAKHCWWDIRQLRTWDDFNLETILSIPAFPELLSVNINASALPVPDLSSSATYPPDMHSLHSTINKYYATKINAALKATQGHDRHAYLESTSSRVNGPHFLTQYVKDYDTIPSRRGRVVGLCKAFEGWNTGMRHQQDPNKRLLYLRSLAQLHWMMREQECRYGFILTEIELVCVRLPPITSNDNVPLFGSLEISASIPLRCNGERKLTACLALWYLHMLTGDEALPGQEHWWVDIGAPAAHTRARCCEDDERDGWIRRIKVTLGESRPAKRVRGWVWPKDDYKPKMEGGRPRGKR